MLICSSGIRDESHLQIRLTTRLPLSPSSGLGWPKPGTSSSEVLAERLLRWSTPALLASCPCWRDEEQTAALQGLVETKDTSHHTDMSRWSQAESWSQGGISVSSGCCPAWARLQGEMPAPGYLAGASICELGMGALSAWLETNRQFLPHSSQRNLN